ncbi:YidB family protein [Blastochloris sulfoviridis]|nr:YidB family protein [Blastochloris sulfoviridis]
MGFLDDVGNALQGVINRTGPDGIPPMITEALAKTSLRDLQGVVTKLQESGLTEQVQSWLGTGANLPISADQIREALGSGYIKQLGDKLGLPLDAAAKFLADQLPEAVDKASPDGTLETQSVR